MKKTSDNIEVPPRCWYYILDFNDRDDWKTMDEMFGVGQLHLLTGKQFWELFKVITERDLKSVTQF